MTKGVFLTAFGNPSYGKAAYNLAHSIKFYDADMEISLLHDQTAVAIGGFDFSIFDHLIQLGDEDVKNPAKIKTSIYEKLPFDYNLYLDVDAMCLQSLKPLFETLINSGTSYATHVFDTYDINSPNEMPWMYWAYRDDIWDKYNLSDHKLPATQSSVQFIKKCEQSKLLFEQLNKNINDPIPLEKLKNRWGGSQPDELYLNIALAQLRMNPHIGDSVLFFCNKQSKLSLTEISSQYYIMSFFGGKQMTRPGYKDYYDRRLINIFRAFGKNHAYKMHTILDNKHADKLHPMDLTRTSKPRVDVVQSSDMQNSLLKNSDCAIVSPASLLPSYKTPRGRFIKTTNYFNPSVCNFNGKNYFVYRMEAFPFCTHTQIGICLLNENLIPIPETNKVLNLHSDVSRFGFEKNCHVEDPRLFIHNNELYLSYTDGWQMGQAKINPETLEAIESFYIKKTTGQEKNWTFFSDGALNAVYTICPHIIYEMNNENWATKFETEFKHNWKWGELRGGTSPVKYKNNFISFFHSSLPLKNNGRQYFMGAYIFSGKAPYKPLFISKEPIIAAEKVNNSIQRLNTKVFVVFPGGVIRNENSWSVAYGYNDYQCRFATVTDELLNDNLVEIIYQKELADAE